MTQSNVPSSVKWAASPSWGHRKPASHGCPSWRPLTTAITCNGCAVPPSARMLKNSPPTLHKGDRVYCDRRALELISGPRARASTSRVQVTAGRCDVLGQIGARKSRRSERSAVTSDPGKSTARDWQRPLGSPDDQIPFAPEDRW